MELSWAVAGGPPGALSPALPAAIELIHAGSLVIDDFQDASETRRGAPALHRLVGAPRAINTGSWMYFAALALLDAAGLALQMLDDLGGLTSDARAAKGREDLTWARLTWPSAWAAERLAEPAFAASQRRPARGSPNRPE